MPTFFGVLLASLASLTVSHRLPAGVRAGITVGVGGKLEEICVLHRRWWERAWPQQVVYGVVGETGLKDWT